MKTIEWYFEHQRRFTLYKKLEKLEGDCIQQIITDNQIIEEWVLTKGGKGWPELYVLRGNKISGSTKVDNPFGVQLSITEIDASGLPKIQSEQSYKD
jgi:hypothetical protein